MSEPLSGHGASDGRTRLNGFIVRFAVVAAVIAVYDHRDHVFGYLPYLALLACPLMHFFHRHGGHWRAQDQLAGTGGVGPVSSRSK